MGLPHMLKSQISLVVFSTSMLTRPGGPKTLFSVVLDFYRKACVHWVRLHTLPHYINVACPSSADHCPSQLSPSIETSSLDFVRTNLLQLSSDVMTQHADVVSFGPQGPVAQNAALVAFRVASPVGPKLRTPSVHRDKPVAFVSRDFGSSARGAKWPSV
jgi:hypothetical protein